jgi:dTDP-4-dehydrorhamnose reductase
MRILIFGKDGQLGHALCREWAAGATGDEIVSHGRGDTDLADPDALARTLESVAPDCIINAAAYTAVDRAEEEPELALRINAEAVAELGRYARRAKIGLIHVSTDYVFDGTASRPYRETDATAPVNHYGHSKRKGEELLREIDAPAIVLRTAWVYSLQHPSFVAKMLGLAKTHETLQVVSDQIGSPTWCVSLARGIVAVSDWLRPAPHTRAHEARGVYHLAGDGAVSRHELVEAIVKIGGETRALITTQVLPVSSDTFPTPAQRPVYTALDCSLAKQRFGVRLPAWRDSLAEALATQEPCCAMPLG